MNYSAAITDFFRSPKWLPNLLLGALCILIPIVGPMVLIGWHASALFGKREPVDFDHYPPFDFNDFGKHLSRGLWPFVVSMAVSMVMVPVMWVLMLLPMGSIMAVSSQHQGENLTDAEGALIAGTFVIIAVAFAVLSVLLMLITKPLMIRSVMVQDFAPAFNLKFVKDFTARTWGAQILCFFALILSSLVVMLCSMLVFCIGIYAGASLMLFVQWHLDRQLYDLYLARGGEPVPVSPKLSGAPPPLPLPTA